jgi:hypothetical protein
MNIIAHIPFLKKLNTEMADVTRAKKERLFLERSAN